MIAKDQKMGVFRRGDGAVQQMSQMACGKLEFRRQTGCVGQQVNYGFRPLLYWIWCFFEDAIVVTETEMGVSVTQDGYF